MGRRIVGSRIPRSKQFQAVALLNTIYLYKSLMYGCIFAWAVIGTIQGLHHRTWDYEHLSRILYSTLHFSLFAAPIISFIALKVKQQIISLYLSFAADSSMAFAILAYSMIIFEEFGFVIGCPMLLGMSFGLLAYSISDAILIRLINSQPDLASEDLLETVRNEVNRARLKEFVGLRKWQGLIEASGGAALLEELMKQKNSDK